MRFRQTVPVFHMGPGIFQVAFMLPDALFKCADTPFQKPGILLRQSLFSEKLETDSFRYADRLLSGKAADAVSVHKNAKSFHRRFLLFRQILRDADIVP